MARIRYVKPEFYSDTKLSEVSILARYLYIGLFCQFDRQGICEDDAKLLKREVFPYDDEVTVKRLDELIAELSTHGRLIRFEYGGKRYLYCPKLTQHQNFHRDEKPRYDIPSGILASFGHDTVPAQCQHGANLIPAPDEQVGDNIPKLIDIDAKTTGTETENGEQKAATENEGFDFSVVWKTYPRKIDRTDAEDRFCRLIKSEADYKALGQAIGRYRSYLLKTGVIDGKTGLIEDKHVKYFTTFLGTEKKPRWRDWLNGEIDVSGLDPPGKQPAASFDFLEKESEKHDA